MKKPELHQIYAPEEVYTLTEIELRNLLYWHGLSIANKVQGNLLSKNPISILNQYIVEPEVDKQIKELKLTKVKTT